MPFQPLLAALPELLVLPVAAHADTPLTPPPAAPAFDERFKAALQKVAREKGLVIEDDHKDHIRVWSPSSRDRDAKEKGNHYPRILIRKDSLTDYQSIRFGFYMSFENGRGVTVSDPGYRWTLNDTHPQRAAKITFPSVRAPKKGSDSEWVGGRADLAWCQENLDPAVYKEHFGDLMDFMKAVAAEVPQPAPRAPAKKSQGPTDFGNLEKPYRRKK